MMSYTKPSPTATMMIVLLSLLSCLGVAQGAACHICGDEGNLGLDFPNVRPTADSQGRTCVKIAMDVAKSFTDGTSGCNTQMGKWKGICCSGKKPAGTVQTGLPPQNVPKVTYEGPYPPCKVCRDGDYPYNTGMVINFLYIGAGSCAQYYKYGLAGKIQTHLCDPVKFFSYEPCGCGANNPYYNKNHPLNQRAQQAPSQNNNNNNPNNPNRNPNRNNNVNPNNNPNNPNRNNNRKRAQQQRVPTSDESGGNRKQRNLKGASTQETDAHDTVALVVTDSS